MQAHKLIEGLEESCLAMSKTGINEISIDYLDTFKQHILSIKMASKFTFSGRLPGLNSQYKVDQAMKEMRLPFDVCYFSFPDAIHSIGILAQKINKFTIKCDVFYLINKEIKLINPSVSVVLNSKARRLELVGRESQVKVVRRSEKLEMESFQMASGYILDLLEVLKCSNIYMKNNVPDKKLQKSRINKGKLPIFEYKTLEIKLSDKPINVFSGNGGSHSSPRFHMRRGHIRRLPKENVWVQPCVVGDKKKGLILKDYKVIK